MTKLTKTQHEELKRLAKEPQPSYGKGRVRVHNNLRRLGLAIIYHDNGFECRITAAGQQHLKAHEPTCCCAGPDYHPDKPCPVHPKVTARR